MSAHRTPYPLTLLPPTFTPTARTRLHDHTIIDERSNRSATTSRPVTRRRGLAGIVLVAGVAALALLAIVDDGTPPSDGPSAMPTGSTWS